MLMRAIAFDGALMIFVSARKLSRLRLVIESARLELCLVFAPVIAGFVGAACACVGTEQTLRLVAESCRPEHLLVLALVLAGSRVTKKTHHNIYESLLPPPGTSPPSPPPGPPRTPNESSQPGGEWMNANLAESLMIAHLLYRLAAMRAAFTRPHPAGGPE